MSETNGNQNNGHSQQDSPANGKVATATKKSSLPAKSNLFSSLNHPEQGVVLRQSPVWSRGLIWTMMGVTTASILWASVAKIEQVVQAKGQLKPQGTVKEIQAPINGVVKEVFIEDGDHVQVGQKLVIFDTTASKAQLESLKRILRSVEQENSFYQTLMNKSLSPTEVEAIIEELKIAKEIAALARNRTALIVENQLFSIQAGETVDSLILQPSQVARLRAARQELESRSSAAYLAMEQLKKQLSQNQVQLADARVQLTKDRQVLRELQTRNQQVIEQSEASLKIEQEILNDIKPLGEEGALARYQINKQQQAVIDRIASIAEQRANGQVEYEKQIQQIQARLAEIDRLQEEAKRLNFAIEQAREQYKNTTDISEKDVRDRIAENEKKIAEIDSQLTKVLVENRKRVDELKSQISQAEQTLKYQELDAPVSGTVFDLKAAPGFVPQPSQAEALLKIVPDDHLIAEVDVTNQDIGFVKTGMKADIRIDSFPFSEYGDIKGEVLSIGSDALPPDEIHKYYRFPTKITLDQQILQIGDREVPLQSGMSVSVNIKIRENRTVLSLFLEQFTRSVESLKEVQ
jgi:HlyD family secretion protein